MKSTPRNGPRRQNTTAATGKRAARDAAAAIGIFDSGIGGLTVMREIMEVLPHEHLIYLGDTGRYPYGSKSPETVRRYSFENAAFLADKGIKMLVVACNTSAAFALDALSEQMETPVIGVIDPGARAAVDATRNRKVGIIGTEGTIASGSYTRALKRLDAELEIYTRACPLFVPLAEEGWIDNDVARATAAFYLTSLKRSGIDTLVLGCTHYPLLADVIAAVMGDKVQLVDSARTTAAAVRETLVRYGLLRRSGQGSASFFVTDATDRFIKVGARFMGHPVESAVRIER